MRQNSAECLCARYCTPRNVEADFHKKEHKKLLAYLEDPDVSISANYISPHSRRCCGSLAISQTFQNHLTKEYALNHIRTPTIHKSLFLQQAILEDLELNGEAGMSASFLG